jgi:putative endonuclease
MTRRYLGQRGEQLAAAYLQRKGYAILTTNWRCPHGELDIVARQDDVLVFVEVRTRYAGSTESAFESVGEQKRERLQTLAYAYLDSHDMDSIPWRIDVIAVAIPRSGRPRIEHVENALDW